MDLALSTRTPTLAPILRAPGALMAPLGWAAAPLAAMARGEPLFAAHLLELTPARMHLIALALDHGVDSLPGDVAFALARRDGDAIAALALGRRPTGLPRALGRLPPTVLGRGDYRRLVALLEEPAAAAILAQLQRIDDAAIGGLEALPPRLRRWPVLGTLRWAEAPHLALALEWLGRCAGAGGEALRRRLDAAGSTEEFRALIRGWIAALPLPDALPPARIGRALRIDRAAELRRLGLRLRNCLAERVEDVESGRSLIYRWDGAGETAVCGLVRCHRLGWFIEEIRGPRNGGASPALEAEMVDAFARHGIVDAYVAELLGRVSRRGTTDPGVAAR